MKNKQEQNANEQSWRLSVQILREIAEAKGISQQEIANRTGMKRPSISRIFSHKFSPTLKTFILIAKAIEVNFFFEDKERKVELNVMFERAMTAIGSSPDKLQRIKIT